MSWPEQTLGQVLARQAGERGRQEALVPADGRFTYRQFFARRRRKAAGALQALGIRRGGHVGLLMGDDGRWLSLFYGAALIGAVTARSTPASSPPRSRYA